MRSSGVLPTRPEMAERPVVSTEEGKVVGVSVVV
jgi:hypothetical protein